jgi:tetratricopeptide (TPR) repeat protein
VFYIICAVILVILPILTYERNKVWKDIKTLYLDCLKKSPNKYRVHYNLAHEYERLFEMDKAIKHYRIAIDSKPDNIESIKARKRVATILAQKGRYQEAIIEISIVLSKNPSDSDALIKLQNYQQNRRQQFQRR